MLKYVVAYFSTGLVFLVADGIWLATMAPAVYRPRLAPVLAETVSLGPAVAFYLLYVVGIVVFAVGPALESGRWSTAAGYGLLFGFFCYATYDLTNQATLRTWSTTVTVLDIAWGAVATAVAATLGMLATSALLDVIAADR